MCTVGLLCMRAALGTGYFTVDIMVCIIMAVVGVADRGVALNPLMRLSRCAVS